jgi:hypothetical protein
MVGNISFCHFFTDNIDFRVSGAQTLSENPIFRMEEHVSHNLTVALWLPADAYYNVGGETHRRNQSGQHGKHIQGRRRHGVTNLAGFRPRAQL